MCYLKKQNRSMTNGVVFCWTHDGVILQRATRGRHWSVHLTHTCRFSPSRRSRWRARRGWRSVCRRSWWSRRRRAENRTPSSMRRRKRRKTLSRTAVTPPAAVRRSRPTWTGQYRRYTEFHYLYRPTPADCSVSVIVQTSTSFTIVMSYRNKID